MAEELGMILATAAGGAFLGKFVEPAAEHLGKIAWERVQRLGKQATEYLSAVGREPQPVEPKILIPLAQAAALEGDETLSRKWAALLANAADTQTKVRPVFVEILRLMVPGEARLLDYLFQLVGTKHEAVLDYMIDLEKIKPANAESDADFYFYIESLTRNNLLINADGGASYGPSKPDKVCYFTTLGLEFLRACRPPEVG